MTNLRLEQYVEKVAANLKSLSKSERKSQIDELRQHLEALVAAKQAEGETEEIATEAALKQFGSAREVGGNLSRSIWRMRLKRMPEPVVTALSVTAAMAAVTLMFRFGYGPLVRALVPALPLPSDVPANAVTITQASLITPSFLLGLFAAILLLFRDGASRTARRILSVQTVAGAAFCWLVLSRLSQSVLMLGTNHALVASGLWDLESLQISGPVCMVVSAAFGGWVVTRLSPRSGTKGLSVGIVVTTIFGILDFGSRVGLSPLLTGPIMQGYLLSALVIGAAALPFCGLATVLNRRATG